VNFCSPSAVVKEMWQRRLPVKNFMKLFLIILVHWLSCNGSTVNWTSLL